MITTEHARDPDLLIDLLRRSPLLEVLEEESLDRREIQERLDVSRATSHRHTRMLCDLGVIEKSNDEFRLTRTGTLLTDALVRFKREAQSALDLAPVLEAVQDAPVDVDIQAFADATVASTDHGDPYSPVARFVALVRETETLYGFDMDAIAPLYIEEIQQRIVDGMETEDICLPGSVENALDGYPEKCIEACASGHLTVKLHADLPFAIAIFDDRVGIGVRGRDTRTLCAFVDTDAPAVREWAEAVYEAYDSEAVHLEEFTRQGFQAAMEQGAEQFG